MAATDDGGLAAARDIGLRLVANVEKVVHGKHDEVALVVAAFAASGHVLLEDVPGTAKTVLARALAASIEGGSAHARSPDAWSSEADVEAGFILVDHAGGKADLPCNPRRETGVQGAGELLRKAAQRSAVARHVVAAQDGHPARAALAVIESPYSASRASSAGGASPMKSAWISGWARSRSPVAGLWQ